MAEAAGFNRLAVGEYHNDAIAWLHALVGATTRVPVTTTIANVHVRHPAVLAEGIAAIRDIHGDRVELGLGLSHATITEHELGMRLQGLDYLEDYARAVVTLQKERSYRGEYVNVAVPLSRNRRAKGGAPVLVAALGPKAVERAATYADGLIFTWAPPSHIQGMKEVARRSAARVNRTPPMIYSVLPCSVSVSRDRALLTIASTLRSYLELPAYRSMLDVAGYSTLFDVDASEAAADSKLVDLLDDVSLAGGRRELERHVELAVAAGIDALVLYPLPQDGDWEQAVRATIEACAPS